MSRESLRVAGIVVSNFIFDEIEAAENFEEFAHLGEAWERENYLKDQIMTFKVRFEPETSSYVDWHWPQSHTLVAEIKNIIL